MAQAIWEPNPQALQQLAEFINVVATRPELTQQISQRLEEFNKVPDFNCYLLYIFKHLQDPQGSQRFQAGTLLKNNIYNGWDNLIDPVKAYIRAEVLSVLGDPNDRVRQTCGSIVTSILSRTGVKNWPEALHVLAELLTSPNAHLVDGAMSALAKIFEDHVEELGSSAMEDMLTSILQKLVAFLGHEDGKWRLTALDCFIALLERPPAVLMHNGSFILEAVIRIAQLDLSDRAQKRVCIVFRDMMKHKMDAAMAPRFPQILEYLLMKTQDKSEVVALHACEFWNVLADRDICHDALLSYLDRLVPVLLNAMKLSNDELEFLGFDEPEDNTNMADKEEDIRPYTNKGRKRSRNDDDDALEWTLRKCAAASLDGISYSFYDGEMLKELMPHINRMLSSSDWLEREAAVLALGCISAGSSEPMQQVLPELVPFLTHLTRDPVFLIRSISCWTLGRYANFVVEYEPQDYMQPVLIALLERMLDRNKKVQEYACSNLAVLCDAAGSLIAPHLDKIIPTIVQAYRMYQIKASFVLHETIGSVCYAVHQDLNRPEYMNLLMPCLIERWHQVDDNDIRLIPLLEALSSVAGAIGAGFMEFSPPVFLRCARLTESFLVQYASYMQHKDKLEEPDERFAAGALDLISSIGEAIGASIDALIAQSNFVNMLVQACACPHPEIKQAAFGTVGVIAKYCIAHLNPVLANVIPMLIEQMERRVIYIRVPNNATWALGEIILQIGTQIEPYGQEIVRRLENLMLDEGRRVTNMLQNVAVTMGRLSFFCPDVVLPRFPAFVQRWCSILADGGSDNEEKESAFRGLLVLIKRNPAALVGSDGQFKYFCEAVGSWYMCPDSLSAQFGEVLRAYKSQLSPQQWEALTSDVSDHARLQLNREYGV